MDENGIRGCAPVEINDEDVLEAMRSVHGYLDITPDDFKAVYRAAYAHAVDRILKAFKASDVMTRRIHVVKAGTRLSDTARLLADKGISGAPVVDDRGKIVGVISEKDFLGRMGAGRTGSFMEVVAHCLKNRGCVATPMRDSVVDDIMTRPAITAPEQIPVADISSLFMKEGINRLPIVDSDDRLVGIVARSDLVRSYCLFR